MKSKQVLDMRLLEAVTLSGVPGGWGGQARHQLLPPASPSSPLSSSPLSPSLCLPGLGEVCRFRVGTILSGRRVWTLGSSLVCSVKPILQRRNWGWGDRDLKLWTLPLCPETLFCLPILQPPLCWERGGLLSPAPQECLIGWGGASEASSKEENRGAPDQILKDWWWAGPSYLAHHGPKNTSRGANVPKVQGSMDLNTVPSLNHPQPQQRREARGSGRGASLSFERRRRSTETERAYKLPTSPWLSIHNMARL